MFSREFKTGAVVLLAAFILYYGTNFLKGNDFFKKGIEVYSVYDKTGGILKSQKVTINGFSIGSVIDVFLHPNNSGKIVVKYTIDTKYPIASNTVAEIKSSDLLGAKEIALQLGNGIAMVEDGDTLKSSLEESISETINKEVLPVKLKAEELLASIDTAISIFTGFLGGDMEMEFKESIHSVNKSLTNLGEITENINLYLEDNKDILSSATKNVEKMTNTLEENRDELNRVFNNIADISDTIAKAKAGSALRSLSKSSIRLDEILRSLENGEGTLGKLVSSDSLYYDIDETVQSLDKLLLDIREHPERYVEISIFGGKKSRKKNK